MLSNAVDEYITQVYLTARADALKDVLIGLQSEDDSQQLRAIISQVKLMKANAEKQLHAKS